MEFALAHVTWDYTPLSLISLQKKYHKTKISNFVGKILLLKALFEGYHGQRSSGGYQEMGTFSFTQAPRAAKM